MDHARQDPHARVAEMRARLIEWDVLGVYGDGEGPGDDGEYDDLIEPIMRWLADGASPRELSANIVQFLHDDYGLEIVDTDAELPLARSFVAWWTASSD
ncbi:hypothetical protein MMX123_02375 [Microbacterium sp. MM2322]|uniref:hypothetical protein n=1 Tax=unclassified Microbacterium TaxID=2609290 RepID=UPI001785C5FE|nr:hypothetical protein [Microbacterium sp. CFBP 13617]MBD8218620.1 hypothetical protein [Microbacterium sp. CFBP 13617]